MQHLVDFDRGFTEQGGGGVSPQKSTFNSTSVVFQAKQCTVNALSDPHPAWLLCICWSTKVGRGRKNKSPFAEHWHTSTCSVIGDNSALRVQRTPTPTYIKAAVFPYSIFNMADPSHPRVFFRLIHIGGGLAPGASFKCSVTLCGTANTETVNCKYNN